MKGKRALATRLGIYSRRMAVTLVAVGLLLTGTASYGAEVGGIYTEASTKDLGDILKVDLLKNLKFRGWIDTYFEGNFNNPKRSVVEANQPLSVIKSRDLTIEGRTFDVHDRSFSLSLAELEIERVPGVGEVGFKIDLAFGDTQDIIVDTIKAAIGRSSVSDFDRYIQHASISYVAPIGRGLRLDLGKFVTHIGAETIESIKNHNYSHGFLYSYAIPFPRLGIILAMSTRRLRLLINQYYIGLAFEHHRRPEPSE